MVVIDATMLSLFINPYARGPVDANGKPVTHARARVEYLIKELGEGQIRVAIPAPALSEVLMRISLSKMHDVVDLLNRMSVFSVEAFDQLAAIELAEMLKLEPAQNRKRVRHGGADTYAKLKYDRQIVAIAKVRGVKTIYSDDEGIQTLGRRMDIRVLGVKDLQIPPEEQQIPLLPHEAIPDENDIE